ncbi:CoA transferase [candidate division KSB1 bacterium]|nr:CoA transferase [candidate division KSB1 bacterium]
MSNSNQACLDGIRILDLSRVLAGPFCTQLLGDLGAEVIKIEQPGNGDDTRQWGPPWFHGESAYYLSCNRNKKSVTANLQTEAGRGLIRQMALHCDVLVENFKVGTMEKWGLGYAALCELNPRLIYCAITGYGQTGPLASRPGYDFIIQAQGGIMSLTGEAGGEPSKVGVAIADIVTGLYALNAILAALFHCERTGEGQFIDVALLDAQVSWLANVAMNYLISGEPPKRYGNAHPNVVPYQTFATAEGHLALGVGNDAQFQRLCEQLGLPELALDSRFRTNAGRVQNRDVLIAQLQKIFLQRTAAEWVEQLTAAGIPAGPITNVAQILADPQIAAREMVVEIMHASGAPLKLLGPAPKFSATPARVQSPPPLLGQHTEEVLRKLLQMNNDQIHELRQQEVI